MNLEQLESSIVKFVIENQTCNATSRVFSFCPEADMEENVLQFPRRCLNIYLLDFNGLC